MTINVDAYKVSLERPALTKFVFRVFTFSFTRSYKISKKTDTVIRYLNVPNDTNKLLTFSIIAPVITEV